jgi:hypothetical protein
MKTRETEQKFMKNHIKSYPADAWMFEIRSDGYYLDGKEIPMIKGWKLEQDGFGAFELTLKLKVSHPQMPGYDLLKNSLRNGG